MENFEECADIFAILSPTNNAARDCFSQVAQKKLENEKWNPSARKNIKANKLPVQVSTYTNDSESDGGTEPSKTFRPVLKGCYTFNLAEAPRQPSKGWLIGGGKFSEGDESPDILLTERKTKFRVSSRHARLAHNFASGALVITVSDSSPVAINGYEVVDAQHVIHGRTTSLEFGDLKYSLEIRKYDTDEDYRSHLSFYKQKYGIMDDDYPWNLLATPADSDLVTQNYVLKNPVGEGSTCVVYAAHNRSNGNAVAVKKVRRTKTNAGLIKQDINISKRIGSHVSKSKRCYKY